MKPNRIQIFKITLILLMMTAVPLLAQFSPTPSLIGRTAPEFILYNLKGDTVSLDQFKGKVIILNFWAKWCGPCRMEIPDFIQMYTENREKGLEIVGITLSSGTVEQIKDFVTQNKMNYPVVTGTDEYLQNLTVLYGGISGIPTTFLIDREGKIRQKWIGARRKSDFMLEVNKYL
jgi:peroxiredoxin